MELTKNTIVYATHHQREDHPWYYLREADYNTVKDNPEVTSHVALLGEVTRDSKGRGRVVNVIESLPEYDSVTGQLTAAGAAWAVAVNKYGLGNILYAWPLV